jgi:hypothetical protein
MYLRKSKSVYCHRLKNATAGEIIFRIKELFIIWCIKKKIITTNHNTRRISKYRHDENLKMPSFRFSISKENITELLNNKIFTLNEDPEVISRIEKQISKTFFSRIDWHNKPFDIRTIWEPARLQNITTLIAYVKANPDDPISIKAKQFCLNELLDWIQKNPFPCGPHYISVMESSLRIPVLFYNLKLLDNLKKEQIELILGTIFQHAWWIEKRLSLYSSLGNHTIAESVGLIFAGVLFCEIKEGKRWFNRGIQTLEIELSHQILDDGGSAEQSFHYHRFVLDLYWLVIDFLERNNLYECVKLKPRLMRAEEFLLAFQDPNGSLPSIGDADDGFAIAPTVKPKRPIVNYHKKKIRIFKMSGYTVIKTEKRTRMIFDHGPLGMSPLYNHGHADALSITLSKDGRKVLVDPGTYRYNGEPEWRQYFKGTKAHNTVTVDGLDQSIQETGFIWSHPYLVKLLGFSENNEQFLINAEHNGYARLKKSVWHQRNLLLFSDSCFLIKDTFSGRGIHDFEINYHLHPKAALIKQNNWWEINNEGARIYMRLLNNDDFTTICGSLDPIHGWYSPRYGIKLKSQVMSCKKRGLPHEIYFITVICTESLIDMRMIKDKLNHFD